MTTVEDVCAAIASLVAAATACPDVEHIWLSVNDLRNGTRLEIEFSPLTQLELWGDIGGTRGHEAAI